MFKIIAIICLGILALIHFFVAITEEDDENAPYHLFFFALIAIPILYLLTGGS